MSKGIRPATRAKYETYQLFMRFLAEELPGKGWSVVKLINSSSEGDGFAFPRYLDGDKRENLVRAFLRLPTVQHDRREADRLLRELQELDTSSEGE